jgi:hypothetical protein
MLPCNLKENRAMNKICGILVVGILVLGCKEKRADKKVTEEKVEFNQDLADELKIMAEVDQVAAYPPQGEYKEMTSEQWSSFKDSIFTTHQKRLKQVIDKYGLQDMIWLEKRALSIFG